MRVPSGSRTTGIGDTVDVGIIAAYPKHLAVRCHTSAKAESVIVRPRHNAISPPL